MNQTYKGTREYLLVLMEKSGPQLIAISRELEDGAFSVEALMGVAVYLSPGDLVFPIAE